MKLRQPSRMLAASASVWSIAACCMLSAVVLAAVGCNKTRRFYREQADLEANRLIDHKAAAVGSEPGEFRINVDPRSRMFDPNSQDKEPMPPDDPVSHQLMQCVDHKRGSKSWRRLPRTPFVENPAWYAQLPSNEDGTVVLDLPGAVHLALLESPRFQSELEDLYLSALDVSFERFRFDTQFFGSSNILFTADGRERSGTGKSSSRLEVNPSSPGVNGLNPGTRLLARKMSATGSELAVGLANSLVWQFSGPNDYSSNTILDFSLVQPLLRRGGRTRVLERLTISERALIANVRQMERFRRGFYLNVVTGRGAGPGPSRRGGVFGGSGLEGFSGVGGGGFGSLRGGNSFFTPSGGGGITGGAGAAGAGGYLGLLQTAQVLRNQHANVASLHGSVEQLQASHEAGRIDRFQVDLAQQALYNAQSRLLTSETAYDASLDSFKVNLGLPPDLEIDIADKMLDPLNLLDPELDALQRRVTGTLDQLRQLRDERQNGDVRTAGEQELAVPNLPVDDQRAEGDKLGEKLASILEQSTSIQAVLEERLAAVHEDFRILEAALPQRRKDLRQLAARPEVREMKIDPELFDTKLLDQRVAQRSEELTKLEKQLRASWQNFDQLAEAGELKSAETLNGLIAALSGVSGQLLELSLLQAAARLESIRFELVELTFEQALAIATVYRRDWMNARAALVDAWRLIYFNANDLLSNLDIVFSGDLGNVGDNPFRFRDSRGRLRVGLEFDAPLTRLAERNVYRQSLIEYQQARRSYYQFRDRVYQGLRNTLRQLRLNEVNFELRRAAVHVAISQVDLTQLRLSEPPKPGQTLQLSNTTARDLVQSLSDLLNVQNDFLSVWVNYEVQRLNLDFDLGVMELAPDGLRVENSMSPKTYLVGLPFNTADMGLSAKALQKTLPLELSKPEEVVPQKEVPDSRSKNGEPLPALGGAPTMELDVRGAWDHEKPWRRSGAVPWPADPWTEQAKQSTGGPLTAVYRLPTVLEASDRADASSKARRMAKSSAKTFSLAVIPSSAEESP